MEMESMVTPVSLNDSRAGKGRLSGRRFVLCGVILIALFMSYAVVWPHVASFSNQRDWRGEDRTAMHEMFQGVQETPGGQETHGGQKTVSEGSAGGGEGGGLGGDTSGGQGSVGAGSPTREIESGSGYRPSHHKEDDDRQDSPPVVSDGDRSIAEEHSAGGRDIKEHRGVEKGKEGGGEEEEVEDRRSRVTDPIFGERRLLKTYEDLVAYVNGSSSATTGGGIELKEQSLTPEELGWANDPPCRWNDVSGTFHLQELAMCLLCSSTKLFRESLKDNLICKDDKPRHFIFCGGWNPSESLCYTIGDAIEKEANKTGGYHERKMGSKLHNPFIATFRGSMYVSLNGQVYTDEYVYDPRGRCSRGAFPSIRPEYARAHNHYKKVYVVDHLWPGFHHDLAEMGSQLMPFYEELLADPSIMIHTTSAQSIYERAEGDKPSAFSQKLIEELRINRTRLIAGDVHADEVVVADTPCGIPEWLYKVYGIRLGKVLREHLLRDRGLVQTTPTGKTAQGMQEEVPREAFETGRSDANKSEGAATTTVTSSSGHSGEEEDTATGKGTMLVIRRSHKRFIDNHDELMSALTDAFGNHPSRTLEVYDDRVFTSQRAIWQQFASADIIVSPHGAGLTNMLMTKRGAVVYEFLQPIDAQIDPSHLNFCYRELALILGLDYFGDFPEKWYGPYVEFDIKQKKWVSHSSHMTVNATKAVENIKKILQDKGWL
ncbi:hypothetical protein CBR_g2787 [Chara braunii]|uniref:Glycosyltransferase 61 catalytic domain-containing protein n=1 Tax=Chara braunii TaxID=69332 RepID=A0A388KDZ8_CHABU|nr:hypothetical protein CBR_g2787 [Chara braunii]|eukprot:GBG68236.1 hypothetical protein CBR_g2787 [Chara braunii]